MNMRTLSHLTLYKIFKKSKYLKNCERYSAENGLRFDKNWICTIIQMDSTTVESTP